MAIVPQTETETWEVENAPGVTITVPTGLRPFEEEALFETQLAALIAEHGSREAIPPGAYDSQIPFQLDDLTTTTPTDDSWKPLTGTVDPWELEQSDQPEIEEVGKDTGRWYPTKYALTGLRRGYNTLTRGWGTIPAGLPRASEETIKSRQAEIELQQEEEQRALGPRVGVFDIMSEWNRQDLLDEINYDKLGEEDKAKYRSIFPYINFEAPERNIADMTIQWATEGLGESLPIMAPGLTAGYALQKNVPSEYLRKIPVVGKKLDWGARAGLFLVGSTLTSMPWWYGNEIERQMGEGRLTAEEIKSGHALAAAAASATLDSLLFTLLGSFGGTIQRTTAANILKAVTGGAAKGFLTEVPTEVLQQVLERLQAGLPISPADEEALREYIEAAALAGVLGPTMGGTVGGVQGYTMSKYGQPSLSFTDMSDMGATLTMVRNAQEKFSKPEFNMDIKRDFSLDIPDSPIPFEPVEKIGKEIEVEDTEKGVLDYVKKTPNITVEDIQTEFKTSPLFPGIDIERQITNTINRLVEKNLITETIDDKGITKFIPLTKKQITQETLRKKGRKINIQDIEVRPTHPVYMGLDQPKAGFPFNELPPDASLRLFWGVLDQTENETTGETESFIKPLKDPETGFEVFKDFVVEEFIPPGRKTPDESLLRKMGIEVIEEGQEVTYYPTWQNAVGADKLSYAQIPMGTQPEARVEKGPRPLRISALFKKQINPDVIPEGATALDIEEQFNAQDWWKYILTRSAEKFVPRRTLPQIEKAILNDKQWHTRTGLREIQNLDTEMTNALKRALKDFEIINEREEFRATTMEAVEDYWSGSKDMTIEDLKALDVPEEVIKSAREMRSIVDKNSKIIEQLLIKYDPEMKRYGKKLRDKIKRNIGSYMTIAYLMHTDPKWKRPDRLGASEGEQAQHETAVNWLADELMNRPPYLTGTEAISKARRQLSKLYDKENSTDALAAILNEPLEELRETEAKEGVTLEPPTGPLLPKTKVPKVIRDVMGEIKDPGTRMLMTAFRQTEFIQGLVALEDLFTLANTPGNRWVSKVSDERFDTIIEGSELNPFAGYYTTEPIARGLKNAFQSGLYGEAFSKEGNPAIARAYNWFYAPLILKPMTMTAAGKILWSPFTQTRNLVSAAGFVMVNGHLTSINPKKMRYAFQQAGAYLRGLTPAEAQRMVDLGVMNTSPMVGDLARTYELAGKMDSVSGVIEMIAEQKPFTRKAGEFVRKTYQFGDDVWKVLMYVAEKEKFTEAFPMPEGGPNYQKSAEYEAEVNANIEIIEELMEGYPLRLTETAPKARLTEAIEHLAAYRTRQNVPNYDAIGEFADVIRVLPTGNFIAFPTEQVRTSWNTVTSGIKEAEVGKRIKDEARQKLNTLNTQEQTLQAQEQFDPAAEETLNKQREVALRQEKSGKAIERRGWTRVFSWMAYNATVGLGLKLAGLLWTVGRKSLKWSAYYALGSMAASWGKDDNEIIVDIDTSTGIVTTINTSGTDAYDVITAPLRTLIRNIGQSDNVAKGVVKGMAEGFLKFLDPYIERSIYYATLNSVSNNLDKNGNEIWKETDSLQTQGDKAIKFIYDELRPGVLVDFERGKQAIGVGAEEYTRYSKEQTELNFITKAVGAQTKERNLPKEWADFQLTNFLENSRTISSGFRRQQYFGGEETLTTSDIVAAYQTANEQYFKLVETERKKLREQGALGLKLQLFRDAIPSTRAKNISKIDKRNLFNTGEATFQPIKPKDFFTKVKQGMIDTLEAKGIKDVRLDEVEFPGDTMWDIYYLYNERPITSYPSDME